MPALAIAGMIGILLGAVISIALFALVHIIPDLYLDFQFWRARRWRQRRTRKRLDKYKQEGRETAGKDFRP